MSSTGIVLLEREEQTLDFLLRSRRRYPFTDSAVDSTLVLDMPCQDDTNTTLVDDVSDSDNDGTLNSNSEDITTTGPGGTLTKAFDGATMFGLSDQIALSFDNYNFNSADVAVIEFFAKRHNKSADHTLCYDSSVLSHIRFESGTDEITLECIDSSGGTIDTGVDTTNWHHYALLLQSDGSLSLYVDGTFVGDFGNRTDTFGVFIIPSATDQFNGNFCGIKIYDELRTQPQILADANEGGLPPDISDIVGSTVLSILANGSLTGSGVLTSQLTISVAPLATLLASGALLGSSGIEINGSSVLLGSGDLAAQMAISLQLQGVLSAVGALLGSSDVTVSVTGTVTGQGDVSGLTTWTINGTSTLLGAGAILAQSAISLALSGTLSATGSTLVGTTSLQLSPTATILGAAPLSGLTTLTVNTAAELAGAGLLNAVAAILISQAATLHGDGVLTGTTPITFTLTARPSGAGGLVIILLEQSPLW